MLKTLYNKLPIFLLLTHLTIGLLYCLYISIFTTTLGGDTLEHMHSSYLVHLGKVPYLDFFQHHNPLLWYVFSPLLGLFDKGLSNNFITSFVISASVIASFLTFYYLYLITKKFISTSTAGIIAASIALTPYVVLSITHFRPDNFMYLCFFAGLYYYFSYLKTPKLYFLTLSFLLFWCSFMFLQKIIFTLIILALITFYLLYRKKINLTDVLYALMLPLILSLAFILYLYHHDILSLWYHSNFTFNLLIPELFDARRIGYVWPEFRFLLICSFLCLIFCFKNSNIYLKILFIIFLIEFSQRIFYFSAFAYYYCLLIYTSSILCAVFINNILLKRFYPLIYILSIALFFVMYKPSIYNGNIGGKKTRFYQPLHVELLYDITLCDTILNGDGTIYNIYNQDPHYYWNLLGQTDVIGHKTGIAPIMDINHVIKTKKPRIISITPYKDKYSSERGIDVIVHNPDMEYINKYYKPYHNSNNLYILKPEFSNLDCPRRKIINR